MEALLRFALALLVLIAILLVVFKFVLPLLGISVAGFTTATLLAVAVWGLWELRRIRGGS